MSCAAFNQLLVINRCTPDVRRWGTTIPLLPLTPQTTPTAYTTICCHTAEAVITQDPISVIFMRFSTSRDLDL